MKVVVCVLTSVSVGLVALPYVALRIWILGNEQAERLLEFRRQYLRGDGDLPS